MQSAALNLDTRIQVYHREYSGIKHIPLGNILSALSNEFPDGFSALQATYFMKKEYRGVPHFAEFGSYTGFYRGLAIAGYLTMTGKGSSIRYHISPFGNQAHNEHAGKFTVSIPNGLINLLRMSEKGKGKKEACARVQEALERLILSDEVLLSHMEALRTRSQEQYERQSGMFLDGLKKKYAQ